jgi:CII-binding regulator of phage lambda lysogenization HflD
MLANINLSIKSKLPKRLVIAGDQAYLEVYNYPRADNAKLIYPDGTSKQFKSGDTKKAVAYEIDEVENKIKNNELDNDTMVTTIKVMEIMDILRKEIK